MQAQADHARTTLDSLPGYAQLRARIAELDNAVAATVGSVRRTADGSVFFTRRGATENTLKLYHRSPGGRETRLVDPDEWEKQTGKPHAINYFAPSPDGRRVAFGVSAAGSEDASIYVLETATGKRIGEPIDRAQYPEISWRPDGTSFFYFRQQELKSGMPATERYRNGRAWLHAGRHRRRGRYPRRRPRRVAARRGRSERVRIHRGRTRLAACADRRGGRRATGARAIRGAARERGQARHAMGARVRSRRQDHRLRRSRRGHLPAHLSRQPAFFDTPHDAGRARFEAVPRAVVPASQQVVTGLAAAKDALYIEARDGAVKRIKRLRWGQPAMRRSQN